MPTWTRNDENEEDIEENDDERNEKRRSYPKLSLIDAIKIFLLSFLPPSKREIYQMKTEIELMQGDMHANLTKFNRRISAIEGYIGKEQYLQDREDKRDAQIDQIIGLASSFGVEKEDLQQLGAVLKSDPTIIPRLLRLQKKGDYMGIMLLLAPLAPFLLKYKDKLTGKKEKQQRLDEHGFYIPEHLK